jgi:hypothetical protein
VVVEPGTDVVDGSVEAVLDVVVDAAPVVVVVGAVVVLEDGADEVVVGSGTVVDEDGDDVVVAGALVEVVVGGAGQRQSAPQVSPPGHWPSLPGGSHCSWPATTRSPHCMSQSTPPEPQQLLQVVRKVLQAFFWLP